MCKTLPNPDIKHKQIHKTLTNTFKTLTNGCTKHYQIIKTLTNIQNTNKHSYFQVFFFSICVS